MVRCLNCQHVKYKHQRIGGLTQQLPIQEWKLERIAMDFVVGLSYTFKSFDVIWVIIDHDQVCSFSTVSNYRLFRKVYSNLHSGDCQFACHNGVQCSLNISIGLFIESWVSELRSIGLYTIGLMVGLGELFKSLRTCFRCVLLCDPQGHFCFSVCFFFPLSRSLCIPCV